MSNESDIKLLDKALDAETDPEHKLDMAAWRSALVRDKTKSLNIQRRNYLNRRISKPAVVAEVAPPQPKTRLIPLDPPYRVTIRWKEVPT